jgi:hypothetical protein
MFTRRSIFMLLHPVVLIFFFTFFAAFSFLVINWHESYKKELLIDAVNDSFKKRRILITDFMYPNSLAAWRLNSIESLSYAFDADILVVHRVVPPDHHLFGFEWNEVPESHDLSRYDLLIFNPTYNSLNWVNQLNNREGEVAFDGTAFNGLWPADYMLRLRKYSGSQLTMEAYSAFYHIFVINFQYFMQAFSVSNYETHFIHWYPGGGFVWNNDTNPYNYGVPESVSLISTQAFTTEYLLKALPRNPVIHAYGGPFLRQGAIRISKNKKSAETPLFICFTSLGSIEEKGADHYVAVAEEYNRIYSDDNVIFYGVGIVPSSPSVVHKDQMPQAELDDFYRDTVDIIFNLDRTNNRHGWPLGLEAVKHGAVLFSTNYQGLNSKNGFDFFEGFVEVDEFHINKTISTLRKYSLDREILLNHSMKIQKRFFQLFDFTSQMHKIILSIDTAISASLSRKNSSSLINLQ